MDTLVKVAFESVAKTPTDLPLAGVSVGLWPSGRTRVCIFGIGEYPKTTMDGPTSAGAELAITNGLIGSDDLVTSPEYREAVSGILLKQYAYCRCYPAVFLALTLFSEILR